jgi:two-component system chemotaxis response regulator CheB
MHHYPKPVIIVSDIGSDAQMSFEALRAGALEVIGKPDAEQLTDQEWVRRFCRKIRMLAEIPVITRYRSSRGIERPEPRRPTRPEADRVELVCIGASTGGPPALRTIVDAFGGPPRWPVLVVQHMSKGFMAGMVGWLAAATGRDVRLAENSDRPVPGVVYIASDDGHLELGGQRVRIMKTPPLGGHRPAVDRLFQSVARSRTASRTVAVVLTGMGSDGARGLEELRRAGAWTIAQDQSSSVVYGMPKAAVDLEAAQEVLPLTEIAAYLSSIA